MKLTGKEKTKENNTATGWRDGHFHFDYLPLQEIARELSNAFHVKIKITDEDIKDFRIRAHFTEGESLDQMLDLLQPAGNFNCYIASIFFGYQFHSYFLHLSIHNFL